ncbi:winged helix-turn-helix domain-containing protein [Halorussus rarus]|uniref:helix-turn-helix transcriptional regulator n=1 Tax=Halorussus TaxID=1070314 RepID=UPI0013B43EB8|nr:helix-turn-helix domain-containing protein [Halorussus rarus]NHN58880.1 GntR family transcriptional regulator [Halorussus sp. JP-T4]
MISTVVKRRPFLDRLAEGPTAKRDLRDELAVSRSTVYKAVRELEEQGLVTETDEGVRLTLVGRLLADEYRAFETHAAGIHDCAGLLSVLPADAPVTVDPVLGADTVLAERHAPTRPVEYIDDLVRRADRVFGATPVVLAQFVDIFHEEIVDGDLTADLVLETPVLEYLQQDHTDRLAEALETGRLSIRRTDEPLPFGFVGSESEGLVLIVYDENGELRGVLLNDSEAAIDWGRATHRAFRDRAEESSLG